MSRMLGRSGKWVASRGPLLGGLLIRGPVARRIARRRERRAWVREQGVW